MNLININTSSIPDLMVVATIYNPSCTCTLFVYFDCLYHHYVFMISLEVFSFYMYMYLFAGGSSG